MVGARCECYHACAKEALLTSRRMTAYKRYALAGEHCSWRGATRD